MTVIEDQQLWGRVALRGSTVNSWMEEWFWIIIVDGGANKLRVQAKKFAPASGGEGDVFLYVPYHPTLKVPTSQSVFPCLPVPR